MNLSFFLLNSLSEELNRSTRDVKQRKCDTIESVLEATSNIEKDNEKEKDRKLTIFEEADKSWESYLQMSNSII